MTHFLGKSNPPTIYIFEAREKYVREHVLFLGNRQSSIEYKYENSCQVTGSPFAFNKITSCTGHNGFPNRTIITKVHETNLLNQAKVAKDFYNGIVSIIYVKSHKETKTVDLKIRQNGDIIFRRKDSSHFELLNARTIIGADGKESIVHDCIPDNNFISCKDVCKIYTQEIKGGRFGNVYIIPKQDDIRIEKVRDIYARNFESNIRGDGYQNRYRILNTTAKFFYLAFQWYEHEVQVTNTNTYQCKPENEDKILNYIQFLTGIHINDEIRALVRSGMKSVFEIKPGYFPRFFYRNQTQDKDYLLIGDSAVRVDFFSGHGLENADQIINSFLQDLDLNNHVLGSGNKFDDKTEKIQVYNCLKHLSSILRSPVSFDSVESFNNLLTHYYGVKHSDQKYLKQTLGIDELKILFNPRHDINWHPANLDHHMVKAKQCIDKHKNKILTKVTSEYRDHMNSILNKFAEHDGISKLKIDGKDNGS
jgi:hypothetical protein